MGKTRVTLKDLSTHLNISRTTLYKYLNNKGYVHEKTRERIERGIRDLGYRPNIAAKNLAMGKEYHIALIGFHSDRSPYFMRNILRGADRAADELHDYGFHLHHAVSPINQPEQQVHDTRKFLADGIDAFAIVPNDVKSMNKVIHEIAECGRPVVTVNRDIYDSERLLYVGCDYVQSGVLAGEVLGKMVKKGTIAVILGGDFQRFPDIRDRYDGFSRTISEFPHISVQPPYRYNDSTEDLTAYLHGVLNRRDRIDGIFDLSYEIDTVARALVDTGNEYEVSLVGFDLSEAATKHLHDHSIDAIVHQDMESQGYEAMKRLFLVVTEQSILETETFHTKLQIIFASNVDYVF